MPTSTHPTLTALGSGLAGAAALTLVHETARRMTPAAPRMDVLGRSAIKHSLRAADIEPPSRNKLQAAALAGDVLSNSIYYAAVGLGRKENGVRNGLLLGLAAGVGAVVLPPYLGLAKRPRGLTLQTKAMTIAWYTLGGLAAGAAYAALADD